MRDITQHLGVIHPVAKSEGVFLIDPEVADQGIDRVGLIGVGNGQLARIFAERGDGAVDDRKPVVKFFLDLFPRKSLPFKKTDLIVSALFSVQRPQRVNKITALLLFGGGSGIMLPVAVKDMLQPGNQVFAGKKPVVAFQIIIKTIFVKKTASDRGAIRC